MIPSTIDPFLKKLDIQLSFEEKVSSVYNKGSFMVE